MVVLLLLILPALPFRHIDIDRKPQPKAHINAILMAIKNYESTYGFLPFGEKKNKEDIIIIDEYDTLMELLTCRKGSGKNKDIVSNARKIAFLYAPDSFKEKGYLDPWGHRFIILLDVDYDGVIHLDNEDIKNSVLVYSCGKDGKDDKGKNDDICSWKD
jgi:hypothetical protein